VESRRDTTGEVAAQRKLSPLGALLAALHEAKIKFQVVRMTAAILQGAPGVTLDADLWVDVPERQYMKLINLSLRLGATMIRQTVVALTDGKLVNFCYRLDGLASFRTEYRRTKLIEWEAVPVRVLPIERVIRSKEAAGRNKDLAMLPVLRDIAASRKRLNIRR
jgi:hypothetical protein